MASYKGTYVAVGATTIVRRTPGILQTLVVQGGSAGTIIGYDSVSAAAGNIVFSFDSTNAIATYNFAGLSLDKGLVIVSSANTKFTVTTGPQQ